MKTKIFENLLGRIWACLDWCGLSCLENSILTTEDDTTTANPHRNAGKVPRGWIRMGILLLAAAASPVFSQDLKENQRWIEQVDGGAVIPISKANSAGFGAGIGGDVLVGYRFDRDFSLSGDLGYYDCDQKKSGATAGEWLYTPLMAVARFNIGTGWIRPYLLLGAGLAFNTYSITPAYSGIKASQQESDLLVSPGAGFLFVVASNMALYVQCRVDIDFTPEGAPGNPFTDSPSLFVPVKAGISFFAL